MDTPSTTSATDQAGDASTDVSAEASTDADAAASLTFELSGPIRYRSPDGSIHDLPWWTGAERPDRLVRARLADGLLSQIDESGPGGRQSCFLTSYLNAAVLRGTLSLDQAAHVQDRLANDPQYDHLWTAGFVRDLPEARAFDNSPGGISWLVADISGVKIGFDRPSTVDEAITALSRGYVVLVSDYRHSRLAFRPSEQPTKLFVHDPKYAEVTGLYEADELQRFLTRPDISVAL